MELMVNGAPTTAPTGTTLADVVRAVTDADRGIAVAVNGEVVPRGGWPAEQLCDGDRVEVLIAAQGG
ncbi:sulfur carrier protein ThiS [Solwaraspora sp. WMMD406]|uniref:sulfur carrier protein ThiS n=1 Tax=Solwaraspora sp. WMMD406 TaxID=3016095 RepID=UPI002415A158|nr:sulfur carrier protein ThiS [Solwaraspora sp. WMMD406]MDG4763704.1 sulfur carrier protein ThiS [Solwaraspora sp. WMMD406]